MAPTNAFMSQVEETEQSCSTLVSSMGWIWNHNTTLVKKVYCCSAGCFASIFALAWLTVDETITVHQEPNDKAQPAREYPRCIVSKVWDYNRHRGIFSEQATTQTCLESPQCDYGNIWDWGKCTKGTEQNSPWVSLCYSKWLVHRGWWWQTCWCRHLGSTVPALSPIIDHPSLEALWFDSLHASSNYRNCATLGFVHCLCYYCSRFMTL